MELRKGITIGFYLTMITLILISLPFAFKQMKALTGEQYSECGYSPYNIYSNSTEAYESFFGKKCYIPVTNYYETKERCGLLGFSCYEASESHIENFVTTVCFYKETGERC